MSTLSYGKDSKKFTIYLILPLEIPIFWGETPNCAGETTMLSASAALIFAFFTFFRIFAIIWAIVALRPLDVGRKTTPKTQPRKQNKNI